VSSLKLITSQGLFRLEAGGLGSGQTLASPLASRCGSGQLDLKQAQRGLPPCPGQVAVSQGGLGLSQGPFRFGYQVRRSFPGMLAGW
jgi:hypothetical protein